MLTELEFKYPYNILYLALAVAAVVFFFLAFLKKEKITAMLRLVYRARLKFLRSALLLIGLGLIVISLMGPQVFTGYTEVTKSGMDIYVLIDTSKSMLVTDIPPDRITIAKKIVNDLLDRLAGDRIGFIPFASGAYIQMPLTDDYQLARMFLDVIDTDMISGSGSTNLAAAIQLANDSFKTSPGADRVIIILSDGEELEGSALNILDGINDGRLRVYTVGIGTERGGLIPVYNSAGTAVVDYMKDRSGNTVTSRLNADTMRQLARLGRGSYYQASLQGIEINSLLGELSALKRDALAIERIRNYRQLYQYFLGAGLFFFLIAWFLPDRRIAA